jgi:uncharacterized protein (DUF2384 family)
VTDQPLPLEIVAGSPTDEEVAAVTAVLHALVAEREAQQRVVRPARDGWERSRRALRSTPSSSDTVWRGFGG